MIKIKNLLLSTAAILMTMVAVAQVTTGSITGSVKDTKDAFLAGATIIAKHIPTGTVYTVTSRQQGRFDIVNIIPGGPYSLTISYVGFKPTTINDLIVPLGDKLDLSSITLSGQEVTLTEIVVSGSRSSTEKTGAGSNFSRRQISIMPNVTRSLTAVTRGTPQSNGTSFAGMNYRYNNITIDGSLFNNNFGRSGDGLVPGGAVSAISIDAIDQVQVNIAPYDVRQAGFIGGGINAVTRRGTNNWYGTAYSFYRDQSFNGKKVLSQTVANQPRKAQIYGGSIGGPIIKDKLFFFVNGEYEDRTSPGQTWLAKRPGQNDGNPQVTPVLATDLDALSTYVKTTFGINTGGYENYDFKTKNFKITARLDWNIAKNHKFTLRFNKSTTDDDDQINTSSTSGITAASISNGRRGGLTGGMAYQTSNFKNNVQVNSGVAELNSSFTSKLSNQFLASYTSNKLKRDPNINVPFVDIMSGSNVYISFGTDLFSYLNSIDDQAWNFADNITLNLGKHSVTGGVSFEKMYFNNSFTGAGGPAYYRYASLSDFMTQKAPTVFAVAYDPSNPKGIKVPEAKFNQLGIYIQDAWTASENFKLTYGLRVDQPFYPYTPPKNQALGALIFKDENGANEQFDVSTWPKSKLLFSPRIGFNWDVEGNKKTIFRGGTGLFTGRIPFIWFVNQVGDNGVIRAVYQPTASADLANIKYNTDRTTYIPTNPPAVGTTTSSTSSYSGVDKDFKMPQVWRTNLAIDKKLSPSLTLTVESIVTKIVNNAYFRNANLGAQLGTLGGTADHRPYYARRLNAAADRMSILDNTNKGWSAAFTIGLQRAFVKNFEFGVSYTFTMAQDVAIGTSDQSASSWQTNNIAGDPNRPEIGNSNFSVPHRIVANLSKKFEYGTNYATTISLFYSASPQERYTYRYASDINGDGATNDMIYIPKDASEIKFVEGFKVGSNVYTAAAQSQAFFQFIENDPYLRKHKGQYMDRYGALLPWFHSLDLRVLQDFFIKIGSKKHTLQASADVINLLNLLNSKWGYRYSYTYGTFQDMGILGIPSSSNNTGAESFSFSNPKFTFSPTGSSKGYQANYSTSSTWGIQLGLRYIF